MFSTTNLNITVSNSIVFLAPTGAHGELTELTIKALYLESYSRSLKNFVLFSQK